MPFDVACREVCLKRMVALATLTTLHEYYSSCASEVTDAGVLFVFDR